MEAAFNSSSFQFDASYTCEGTCKDESFRNSTVATEASTFDDSSKQSQQSFADGVGTEWETHEIEFLAGNSLTDCSKLSSDHGSSKNTGFNLDSLNYVKRNQFIDKDLQHIESLSEPVLPVVPVPNNDSFYISYESDVRWVEGDSTESDDELQYMPLEVESIRALSRGRSMSYDQHSTRGKSIDSKCKRTTAGTTGRTASPEKLIERNMRRADPQSNFKSGREGVSNEELTPSRKECKTNPSRRGCSIPRRSSFSILDGQPNISRFARSKRKTVTSQRLNSAPNETDRCVKQPSTKTNDLVGQRTSAHRRIIHSNSMPIETSQTSTRGNTNCYPTEGDVRQRQSRRASSPNNLCDRTLTRQDNDAPTVTRHSTQKVVHPLTAKLLAELIMTGQATVQLNGPVNQSHCHDISRRRNETVSSTLLQPLSNRKSVEKKKTLRNELGSFGSRRFEKQQSFPQEALCNELPMGAFGSRRFEKQQSMPEAPIRKSKAIQHHTSCNVSSTESSHSKQNIRMRPKIENNQSFPGSPPRRHKTFTPSSRSAVRVKEDEYIEEMCQQLNCVLQTPAHTKSFSGRPKRVDHHTGGLSNTPSRSQSEKIRSLSDPKKDAGQRKDVGQRRDAKHINMQSVSSRGDEVNAAISNYFTPRNPTPHRHSDHHKDEGNPDDSAFWNIDPNAFEPTTIDSNKNDNQHRNVKRSFAKERFL